MRKYVRSERDKMLRQFRCSKSDKDGGGCNPSGLGWEINGTFHCTNHVAVVWLQNPATDQFLDDCKELRKAIDGSGDSNTLRKWLIVERFLKDQVFEMSPTLPELEPFQDLDSDLVQ